MYDPYLAHYGVKGMKWGVRRKARKDAKEYARAKMYYGEGAGNRRKLIRATVKSGQKTPATRPSSIRHLLSRTWRSTLPLPNASERPPM